MLLFSGLPLLKKYVLVLEVVSATEPQPIAIASCLPVDALLQPLPPCEIEVPTPVPPLIPVAACTASAILLSPTAKKTLASNLLTSPVTVACEPDFLPLLAVFSATATNVPVLSFHILLYAWFIKRTLH